MKGYLIGASASLDFLVINVLFLAWIFFGSVAIPDICLAEGHPQFRIPLAQSKSSQNQWKLPLDLNDNNLAVWFEVDSNIDLLSATMRNVRGKAWLSDPADTFSLNTLLKFPVAFFDLGSNFRNETLQEMLNEPGFPEVILRTTSLSGECSPSNVIRNGPCDGLLHGSIEIRGIERSLELPCRIEHDSGSFVLSGKRELIWKEFKIEDPEVLFLRLQPTVFVHYQCQVPLA